MIENLTHQYLKYRKTFVIPAVTLLLFVILFPLVTIPQIQSLARVQGELSDGKPRLIRLEMKRSKLSSVDEDLLKSNFALTAQALPSQKDIGAILVTLDLLAQQHGVLLGNFSASVGKLDETPVSIAPAPSLQMTISAKGERGNIESFLKGMSEVLPLVTIETIEIKNKDITVSFLFYYKPLPPTLPPVDSPLPDFSQFQPTLASLSARRSQVVLPPAGETEAPSQLFERANPFF